MEWLPWASGVLGGAVAGILAARGVTVRDGRARFWADVLVASALGFTLAQYLCDMILIVLNRI